MEYDEINNLITILAEMEDYIINETGIELMECMFDILEVERMKALIHTNIDARNKVCEQDD